jgi:ketosteroid isomerase-like protein
MLAGLALVPGVGTAKSSSSKDGSVHSARGALKGECVADNTTDCWNALAVSLARQGRLEEARQALEAAFQADPRLKVLRGNLELLYGNLAKQAYDSALGLPAERSPVDLALLPELPHRTDKVAQASTERARESRHALAPAAPVPEATAPVALAPRVPVPKSKAVDASSRASASSPDTAPAASRAAHDTLPGAALARAAAVPVPSIPVAHPMAHRNDPKTVVPKPSAEAANPVPPLRKDSTIVAAEVPVARVSEGHQAPAAKPKAPVAPSIPVAPLAKAATRKPSQVREEVRKALESWAAHWSAKDADGYLSSYAPDFVPSNGAERSAWESQRRERISAPASIDVSLESVRIEPQDSGRVATQFLQLYRTEAVKLRSRKRMVWERCGETWKIVAEGEAKQ